MIAIISLLIIVSVSILITRIASIALTHTGLSRETARFQARSAFTGVGFTTTEAETMVNHPVRRRIIMLLMLLGNAGIVTAMSSLILTFVHEGGETPLVVKVVLLLSGLACLWTLSMSQFVDRHLSRLIDWALKRYTNLDVKDYASLMHLVGEYRVVEMVVQDKDWVANKTLADTELRDEGIVVLGIKRPDETYLGAPKGEAEIVPGDTLILYGRVSILEKLDQRRKSPEGDREHQMAVGEQQEVEKEEQNADPGGSLFPK